jgi:hypothetical protein
MHSFCGVDNLHAGRRRHEAAGAAQPQPTLAVAAVRRYNSYMGGVYYSGYNGYDGRPRITLTLVIAPSFNEAVVINNRAGRGGVSPEARQVHAWRL